MRDDRGRFLRGSSGNPGGRPARTIPMDLGIEAMTIALEGLVLIIRDPRAKPHQRLRACSELLRRVAGRTGRVRGAAELAMAWGLMPPESRRAAPPQTESQAVQAASVFRVRAP